MVNLIVCIFCHDNVDQRPKCKVKYKPFRRKHGSKFHDLGLGRGLLDMILKAQATKRKNR